MKATTVSVPNAIIFVMDPTNSDASVPAYRHGEVTAATSTCVSVATLPEVDGDITVRLAERGSDPENDGLVPVFDGVLETPGGKVAIVTSELESVLEAYTAGATTRVTISVDEVTSPGLVHVVAG
ncbi:MAG TPA: hypothetical protein VM734_05445 [Kofleriaceae bacterium]|nr:hypothetical protein [Vicinamibacterales bacterium]HVK72740.1 hypothetical protein [Kofleriaceae bacterium]